MESVWGKVLQDLPGWLDISPNVGKTQKLHPDTASLPEYCHPIPPRKNGSGKRNVITPPPKDPNFEVCRRTKMTRAPRRKCTNNHHMPRAEKSGDMIRANHKIHLATQWIHSYLCKTRTSKKKISSSNEFIDANVSPKEI